MNILLTGGAGYIGSHVAVVLSQAGHEVVLLDNFCNSKKNMLERLQKILGKPLPCVEGDVRNKGTVNSVFENFQIDSVIHLAGLKNVNESSLNPLEYYDNNVAGTLNLLEVMKRHRVQKIIFSSSASVYGDSSIAPIKESDPLDPKTSYGRTKMFVEKILRDLYASENGWMVAILRYFNPVGAHHSGLIGECSLGHATNLMPLLIKVASGHLDKIEIYGNDYSTRDGTGVRDFIHVDDLAKGHLAALNALVKKPFLIANLGTGRGYTVLEIVKAFQKTSGQKIAYQFKPRRVGDIAISYTDTSYANQVLGWRAEKSLEIICRDAWNWHQVGEIENG